MKKLSKLNGFTLAEVLITLGIIGVVAALTVPSVHGDYKKKGYVTSIRKILNDFDSAVDTYITEEGKTSFAATGANAADGFDTFMKTKFQVVKTCNSDKVTSCFAPVYKSINGTETKNMECSGTSYALSNSAVICSKINTNGNVEILIDTNGPAGPNLGGRDMFNFSISKNGTIETGDIVGEMASTGSNNPNEVSVYLKGCAYFAFGNYCLTTLKQSNWVMNY